MICQVGNLKRTEMKSNKNLLQVATLLERHPEAANLELGVDRLSQLLEAGILHGEVTDPTKPPLVDEDSFMELLAYIMDADANRP